MQLRIDPRILDEFPGVRVGALFVDGVDNSGGDPEIRGLLSTSHQLHRGRRSCP